MPQFKIIKSKEIENALSKTSRQYLVGNLSKPQILENVKSEKLEIGISDYKKGGEFEEAHFHPKQTEYQLILWGETEYYDLTNNKVYRFKKGDFYCTESNVKYAQKILEKTRIFFIKIPAVNDKTLCEVTREAKEWKENNAKLKIKLGKYRHYKGKEYEVVGFAKDSETLEDLVIYKALYNSDEFGNNAVWVRPVEMFLGKVDADGEEILRFEYIG